MSAKMHNEWTGVHLGKKSWDFIINYQIQRDWWRVGDKLKNTIQVSTEKFLTDHFWKSTK